MLLFKKKYFVICHLWGSVLWRDLTQILKFDHWVNIDLEFPELQKGAIVAFGRIWKNTHWTTTFRKKKTLIIKKNVSVRTYLQGFADKRFYFDYT